ncbi:MAG: class I SAM-dependent methyltransferase [Anaerolineae bacterium]|nr:class I SAM-dependent methyltransferase [Anaerolineae bacterium]
MNVQDAYNQWSVIYDTNDNPTRDLDADITRKALKDLRCNTIVEAGCGTGKNTAFLAECAHTVYALDFSPEMLAKAAARISAENVRFVETDLTQPWPVESESAEFVTCNLVLEHIADLNDVFSEAARVLSRSGHFYISELHPFKQYQGTVANFQQHGVTTQIDAFVHHISDFLAAATANGLHLLELGEWWHADDVQKPPRLITFLFEKT